MDIREFVYRHMHSDIKIKKVTTGRFAPEPTEDVGIRNSEIANDQECRELCARFLFTEIWMEGRDDPGYVYDPNKWEPLAEHFITTIVPSLTFMEDALNFFNDIREGKYDRR